MMVWLNALALRVSSSGTAFAATAATMLLSILALGDIATAFAVHASGRQPIDMQMYLSAEEVAEQLPLYTDTALILYRAFAAVDFLFPFAAALLTAALAAYALRQYVPEIYSRASEGRVFAWLFLPGGLDYIENLFMLGTASSQPAHWRIAENIVALVHNAKITLVMPLMAFTVIVATAAIAGWFRQIGNETNG